MSYQQDKFTEIANAIREKTGKTDTIPANDFPKEILSISPPTPQEQSDWTQTDNTVPSYIKNKPDLLDYMTKAQFATNSKVPGYENYVDKAIDSKSSKTTELILEMNDSRNYDAPPNWYYLNLHPYITHELKNSLAIGINFPDSPEYVTVTTYIGWRSVLTISNVVQIALGDNGMYFRNGINATKWDKWQKILNQDVDATKIVVSKDQPILQKVGDIWLKVL